MTDLQRWLIMLLVVGVALTIESVFFPALGMPHSRYSCVYSEFVDASEVDYEQPNEDEQSPSLSGLTASGGVSGVNNIKALQISTRVAYFQYLPKIISLGCEPIPNQSYGSLTIEGSPSTRPAEMHADINLALRGYKRTNAYKGFVNYGSDDPQAPQLRGLFADHRRPLFNNVYQVYDWDWKSNSRGALIANPPVTMAGLAAAPCEVVYVPDSGYTIGNGYEVLVLYAHPERITLKYTREDNVVYGYTLHIENIHVDSNLVALYQLCNANGRYQLPALRPGQAFGRVCGDELRIAIRDCGLFMDPRSQGDWWIR